MVEGYPHDLQGEKIRSQFLYSTTRSLFEESGQLRAAQGKEELRDAHDGPTCRSVSTLASGDSRTPPTPQVYALDVIEPAPLDQQLASRLAARFAERVMDAAALPPRTRERCERVV